MNTLRHIAASLVVLLVAIYLGGYAYLKFACYSTAYVPSDPWKASGLSMRSKVSHWGELDLTMPFKLSYRDPGINPPAGFAEFLNAIYLPLQKIDEPVSGWAVRFNSSRIE